MQSKKCSKCEEIKGFDQFYNKTSSKDGKMGVCIECRKSYDKARYEEKRDEINAKNKARWKERKHKYKTAQIEWRKKNGWRMNELDKARYWANREENMQKRRDWYAKNREKILEEKAEYFQLNKERINKAYKDRKKNNPIFKVACTCRSRIHTAIKSKGFRKNSLSAEMLGCDWETLKSHIEGQFEDGMTWENHGEWHIDHITPFATAETGEDIFRLSHYSNLQPLWAEDNLRKGAKIEKNATSSHMND